MPFPPCPDRTPGAADLWHRIADLDHLPLIDEQYWREYFAGLRAVAVLVASLHLPPAT